MCSFAVGYPSTCVMGGSHFLRPRFTRSSSWTPIHQAAYVTGRQGYTQPFTAYRVARAVMLWKSLNLKVIFDVFRDRDATAPTRF
jgi:hypothetical protein